MRVCPSVCTSNMTAFIHFCSFINILSVKLDQVFIASRVKITLLMTGYKTKQQ